MAPLKQKSLQAAALLAAPSALSAGLCVSCILAFASLAAAQGVPSSDLGGQPATLRLIATPGLVGGTYEAGVELTMSAGSHTYWKMPGDAGVPPVFDFSGSENVVDATVAFPAPTRISEEGFDAFGYTGRVVFPIAVVPRDAARPARLHVDVTYAVCGKICVPGHGEATLTLAPKGAGVDGELVATALTQVPAPLPAAERTLLTITPDPGAPRSTWTLAWSGAAPVIDIFPDAPEGFVFDTRKLAADRWRLTAAQSVGTTSTVAVPVSLVLKRDKDAASLTETLDVKPETR